MRNKRKGGLKWFLSCVHVSWVFTVATSLVPLAATVQTAPLGYTRDNSDWWSLTRTDDEAVPQEGDPPDSDFQILGFKLNDETFANAKAKLGKTTVVERGDGSAGCSQVCYSSPGKKSKTYLIFEKGEVNDAFYLFNVGPEWKGSEQCSESNLSQPIYQRIPACTLGKQLPKLEPYLENLAFHPTIKLFTFSALRKKRQPQTSRP